jgi:hypothetical protein
MLKLLGEIPAWAWFTSSALLFLIMFLADRKEWIRRVLEPWHLLVLGLAGVVTFAAVAIGAAIWQWRREAALDPRIAEMQITIGNLQKQSEAAPANKPAAAISPPAKTPVQDREAKLAEVENASIKRYVRLMKDWPLAKKAAEELDQSAKLYMRHIKQVQEALAIGARQTHAPPGEFAMQFQGGVTSTYLTWDRARKELKRINDLDFPNRPFNIETTQQLENWLMKAPGEDIFDENEGDKKLEFRKIHFLTISISSRASALIREIEEEIAKLRSTLASTSVGQVFIQESPK